jgi:hypothetical protein
MTIKFDGLKLEGDAGEALRVLLADKGFTTYVEDAVKAKEDAVKTTLQADIDKANAAAEKVAEFRDKNIELKKQIEELQKLGSDADKIDALKQEYEAKLKGSADKYAEIENKYKEATKQIESNKFDYAARIALSKYNLANKGFEAHEGADEVILQYMKHNHKIVGDNYVMLKDGSEFTDDSGFAPMDKYIKEVIFKERPFCFNRETGGGAGDNVGGGGDSKTMTRDEFNKLPPLKQAEVATSRKVEIV